MSARQPNAPRRPWHERLRLALHLCTFGPWHHLRGRTLPADITAYGEGDEVLGVIHHRICQRHTREAFAAFKKVPHTGTAHLESGRSVSWSKEESDV